MKRNFPSSVFRRCAMGNLANLRRATERGRLRIAAACVVYAQTQLTTYEAFCIKRGNCPIRLNLTAPRRGRHHLLLEASIGVGSRRREKRIKSGKGSDDVQGSRCIERSLTYRILVHWKALFKLEIPQCLKVCHCLKLKK